MKKKEAHRMIVSIYDARSMIMVSLLATWVIEFTNSKCAYNAFKLAGKK